MPRKTNIKTIAFDRNHRNPGLLWLLASLLIAAAITMFSPMQAVASTITYWVDDHPDGGACLVNGCYILRLDGGADGSILNTFSANGPGAMAAFSWNTASPDQATLSGMVRHNQGLETDLYDLTVNFSAVKFTDPSATEWWDGHNADELYDDSLEDLQANSTGGAETPNNSDGYSTLFDRIYFQVLNMVLTPKAGVSSFSQPGITFGDCPAGTPADSFCFDEYPNLDISDPNAKFFFIQRDHRTSGHAEVAGSLTAAGWVQAYPNQPRPTSFGCCEDLLFLITHKVPEPGTLAIFAAGLAGLGFLRRRRRA